MSIPNETLMAYVDGELDASARATVEAAMGADPEVERRVEQYRALNSKLRMAYASELEEPVPEKLLATLRKSPRPQGRVLELERRRAAVSAVPRPRSIGLRWRSPTALAASMVVAIGLGVFAWQRSQSVLMQEHGGSLVASGALARSLSVRLSGEPASGPVGIGVSFLATNGEYCRTFTITGKSAGLACRNGSRWEIDALTPLPQPPASAEDRYRTASSSLPAPILQAVQARIAGEPLGRDGEERARAAEWRSR